MESNQTIIKDRWLFIFAYPIMALMAVHIGNDNAIAQLIRIPSYYTDILLALSCTYLFGFYIRKIHQTYETRFYKEESSTRRLLLLIVLGIIVPTLLIILIEIIYLFFLGFSIQKSSVLYLELPITLLFCLLINLIYFILYQNSYEKNTSETPLEQDYKTSFVIKSGNSSIQISLEDVAYFIKQDGLTFLITTNNKKFLYDNTLESTFKSLSPKDFFQLNRQVIAHKCSIKKFNTTETRRLHVELSPLHSEEVFVPKTKASAFIEWLK